ncbi:MAG: patatin-like phospholipase family protein [Alistipes sp.]
MDTNQKKELSKREVGGENSNVKENHPRLLSCLLLVMLCFLSSTVLAQKVGVTMSGGGAKGLYHIGVLQALEENGIPIDYVSGTSMGSIVAALYAAGYSPEEMRAIVMSGQVKSWVSGKIDDKYFSYYRQVDRHPAAITMHLGFTEDNAKRKLKLPTHLISSVQIDMALTGLLSEATAACRSNFDSLMVPFRCLASDLNTRKPVVLAQGSLAEAVRASMSIPLAFKPIRKDSMLLYDGGIYNNFPWQTLDETFHPDLLIGVKCTDGSTTLDENMSLLDQAFLLSMEKTDYTMPEGRSILINRAVAVNMLDFDKAEAIMASGYADALEQMPEIKARIHDFRSIEATQSRRAAFRAKCPPLVFDHYEVTGLSRAQAYYVRDFVRLGRGGRRDTVERPLPFDRFRDNLYMVLANGDFVADFPKVDYNPISGRYGIQLKMTNRPHFKVMVGGNISSTAFNQAYIGVSYELIDRVAQTFSTDLYIGPIYSTGAIGGRTDFFMWRPLFLDYSFNFSAKSFRHGTFGHLTDVTNTEQVKESEIFGSVGTGFVLTHKSVVMLRVNAGHTNARYDPIGGVAPGIDKDVTDHSRFSYIGVKAEIARNTFDKPLYPRRGSYLSLSGIYIYGRDKYEPYDKNGFLFAQTKKWLGASLTWEKYWDIPSCKWFSFGFNFKALITDQPQFSNRASTMMFRPAYQPIPHAHMVYIPAFRAAKYIAGGVMPTFDFTPNFFFRAGFYAMYRERNYPNDSQLHYIAEASFVYHTAVGPVSLSLTKYDLQNWHNMYLTFNFGYAIFAPKGTFY